MSSRYIDLLLPRAEDHPMIAAALQRLLNYKNLGSRAQKPAGPLIGGDEAFEQDGDEVNHQHESKGR
jgi:hypothetical protein